MAGTCDRCPPPGAPAAKPARGSRRFRMMYSRSGFGTLDGPRTCARLTRGLPPWLPQSATSALLSERFKTPARPSQQEASLRKATCRVSPLSTFAYRHGGAVCRPRPPTSKMPPRRMTGSVRLVPRTQSRIGGRTIPAAAFISPDLGALPVRLSCFGRVRWRYSECLMRRSALLGRRFWCGPALQVEASQPIVCEIASACGPGVLRRSLSHRTDASVTE